MKNRACPSVRMLIWKQMRQKKLEQKLQQSRDWYLLEKITQTERVKLNRSNNWVRAKSQSSKANRFKVLNEKDNRIKEPDVQREQHFTVLDPVNHLVGYPRVQVQGERGQRETERLVLPPSESGFLSPPPLWEYHGYQQMLSSKTNANLFAAEYISLKLFRPSVFQKGKQAICRRR